MTHPPSWSRLAVPAVSNDTQPPQAASNDPEHVDDPGCRRPWSHTPWRLKGRLNYGHEVQRVRAERTTEVSGGHRSRHLVRPCTCTDEWWSPLALPLTLNRTLAELVDGNVICPMPVRVVTDRRTVVAGDPRLTW